ncbi:MAG: tRNA (N(6)-L-threonylcarbamoyladenosine(37)-C(2))-methylthiotransferase MtaB [Acetivibrionales bacterium]
MKTAAFYTLGCKVNQYETEAMAEAFEKAGYKRVGFEEAADVYVINTCTVTGLSSRKSRQAIRRAKQLNKNAIVAAVGCYPQTARQEVENMPEVDIIAGTGDRLKLPGYVAAFMAGRALNEKGKLSVVGGIMENRVFEDLKITSYKERTRAFIKVQDGCSRFCSYCIIPYARGPVRSRPAEEVVCEVRKVADAGFKEVILTGIHLASYGMDQGKVRLQDLIALVHEVDGIERIRIGSIEPSLITDEFVSAVSGMKKLCPHYHVSLQSGCDETLKRMNRRYTAGEYKQAINRLRENIPDVAVSTDVMVGFPGETEEEFEKTYEFLAEIRFSRMHVFKFSPRKGTPAADFPGQVEDRIKEERSKRVIELSERCAGEFIKMYAGREMPVLYEREARTGGNVFEGLTPNYIRVLAGGNNNLIGNIRDTRIIREENGYAIGETR